MSVSCPNSSHVRRTGADPGHLEGGIQASAIMSRRRRVLTGSVIPDIHSRWDLLNDGLARIAEHAASQVGTIVALGDYVNKGPNSKQVIDWLRVGPPDGWTLIPLKGNHDTMMVEALRSPAKMNWWLEKGGDAALASYGGELSNVPSADIEWLDKLPLMHTDIHRLYVHAGVDPNVPLDQQQKRRCYGTDTRMASCLDSVAISLCMVTTHSQMDQGCTRDERISIHVHGGPVA